MGRNDQGVMQSRRHYEVIPRTLSFITHGDDVLLLRGGAHKRLWAGLYNGVGGHVESGEDVYTSALREIVEETGLNVHDLRLCGVVHAESADPNIGIMLFVFRAYSNSVDVTASVEGTLEWLPRTHLPRENVVEDLPQILDRVLSMGPEDPPFSALYTYDAQDRLVISFAQSV